MNLAPPCSRVGGADGGGTDNMDALAGEEVVLDIVPLTGATVAATIGEICACRRQGPLPHHAINNNALKWLRDTHEDPPGQQVVHRVDTTSDDPLEIGVLERDRGMAYRFLENESQLWSWKDMLASFQDEVMVEVTGLGVSMITCQPIQGTYDHTRHHAQVKGEGPELIGTAPIWDFVVTQTDGTQMRFHTEQTSTKVSVSFPCDGGVLLPGPPMRGLGRSDYNGM